MSNVQKLQQHFLGLLSKAQEERSKRLDWVDCAELVTHNGVTQVP